MDISHDTLNKQKRLRDILRVYKKASIAFSGGADSAFLLHEAIETLGRENVLAITARSPAFPEGETKAAEMICKEKGAVHILFDADVMSVKEFRENCKDRCYHCKKAMFIKIGTIAKEKGFMSVADGSNIDDEGDYRPGLKALEELGIKSPLKEAGLSKDEIRHLSKIAGLSTWNKPSLACLASRIPYGDNIDEKKLKLAGDAEEKLHDMGFDQIRVRIHGSIARIETKKDDLNKITEEKTRLKVSSELKKLGFTYVAVDLDGYRSGSLNETL